MSSIPWSLGVLLTGFLAAACSSESGAPGSKALRFSAIPDANTTELELKFGPLAEYLSEQLGVAFEYVPVASYDASVEAFRHGDIQLAWFGGLTGVQARAAVPGARAIAQGEIDPHFRSYFIAHSSSGIERSEEFPTALEGKSFTFGSSRSTSGRLMPDFFIREHTGRAPREFFDGAPGFAGNHDKTAELVQAGAFDAGAISYARYDQLVAEGKIDPGRCTVVWETPEYADYNWTVHPQAALALGEGYAEKLQRVLLAIEDPELLNACLRKRFIAAKNSDFEAIRNLALELDFLRE